MVPERLNAVQVIGPAKLSNASEVQQGVSRIAELLKRSTYPSDGTARRHPRYLWHRPILEVL